LSLSSEKGRKQPKTVGQRAGSSRLGDLLHTEPVGAHSLPSPLNGLGFSVSYVTSPPVVVYLARPHVCPFRWQSFERAVCAQRLAAACLGGGSVGEPLRDPGAPDSPGRPGRGGEDLPGQAGRGADAALGTEGFLSGPGSCGGSCVRGSERALPECFTHPAGCRSPRCPRPQSVPRRPDLCDPVASPGSHWLLADLPCLRIGCLGSEAGSVAAESGRGVAVFWPDPERPQRGHRHHRHPIGWPGVRLRAIGRGDGAGLCGG
ncbi:hypothetical protein EPR50_G00021220, partial [Perca flavescens]